MKDICEGCNKPSKDLNPCEHCGFINLGFPKKEGCENFNYGDEKLTQEEINNRENGEIGNN